MSSKDGTPHRRHVSRSREPDKSQLSASSSSLSRRTAPSDSMEYTGIVMPTLEGGTGPVALGDLWNCRTNTVEGNLFDKPLTKEYLQADPIQTLDYSFRSCKTTKDVTDIMKISASFSVDFASDSTPIEVSGSGAYAKTDVTNFRQEQIVVTYDTMTYQVRVRPSAFAIVSDQVKALILGDDPKIVATHFVQAVLVGGKATGSIAYSENVSDSDMSMKGDFKLSAKLGPVTIEAEAQFEKLDKEHSTSYSTVVNVQAQPRFTKSPVTCEEMFTQVKELDDLVSKERHFPELDKIDDNDTGNPKHIMRVTGVPIRFKLVPISHILTDHSSDPLFKLLEEDLLADFSSMLFNLRDYTNPEYVKMRLGEMQPSIIPILMDDFNPLTIEIRKYALAKAEIAVKLKRESALIYIAYKTSQGETKPLSDMLTKYDEEFKPIEAVNDLLQFKEDAKKELAGIRSSDVDGIVDENGAPSIRFFSNETDLADWYNTERTIKVLLKTDFSETSPTGVFLKLYDMSPTLVKYGIEVGVAFPNISQGLFTLTYKTQYETTVYTAKEIRFALEVLAISVDEGETISKIFYSINAALYGLNLPMTEYLFDVPNLVKVMKGFEDTVICETYCDLLARLTESLDTWNLVIPIQALNTGVEMMRFFRQLRVYIPQRFPDLKHRFLVSRFNNVNDKFYSPLVLIFLDNIFQALCMDHLEILMMMEQFAKPVPDWTMLAFNQIRKSCLYPPRGDWAISVVQNLILDHQTFNTDPIFDLPEFPNNDDPYLSSAMQVTRVSAMRNEPEVLTAVSLLALQDPGMADALEAVLALHGWKDDHFSPLAWSGIDWDEFFKDIRNFLANQAPFLMKVVLALDELRAIPQRPPEVPTPDPEEKGVTPYDLPEWDDKVLNDKIDAIIIFILEAPGTRGFSGVYSWHGQLIDEEQVYRELRAEVLTYNGMPGKIRKVGIIKLFEAFIAKQSTREELFHVFSLSYLVEGMQSQLKSLKHVLLPMCKRYCDRLTLKDEEYPRGSRRLQDSLTERQLFKTVGVLSEVRYNSKLYVIHQELFNFSTLPAPTNIKSLIEKITSSKLNDDQLETIWTNPKFLYALRQVAENEGVLDTLYAHVFYWNHPDGNLLQFEEDENDNDEDEDADSGVGEVLAAGDDGDLTFPYWIPTDIVEKVKTLIALREKPNYEYPRVWVTVHDMIAAFQIIYTRQVLAYDFATVLRTNVAESSAIKNELEEGGILFYWNEEDQIFENPWSVNTVNTALSVLKAKYPEDPVKSKHQEGIKVLINPKKTSPKKDEDSNSLVVNTFWKPLVRGGRLSKIDYPTFHQLDLIRPTARTEYDELEKSATTTLRFLYQQIRNNGSSNFAASFFEHYIHYPKPGHRPGVIDFGDGIPTRSLGILLSRGDIQTALFQLTDPVVTHLALMSMAKTPVPLPFLVTSIGQQPIPKSDTPVFTPNKAILLHPALQDVIVPEMEVLVPNPRLFRDPYRFVVTLRVGDTSPELGRSSMINSHLMKDPTFFSSKLDPGSSHGRPLNRSGFLEFSWLTESTCDPVFWSNCVAPEYQGQRKQIILLGLLHGDALSLPSLLEVVRPHVSCFVVFWKVSNYTDLRKRKRELSTILGNSKTLDVILYPDPTIVDKVHDQNLIYKQIPGGHQDIVNKAKLLNLFMDGISYTVKTAEELGDIEDPAGPLLDNNNSQSFLSSITSGLSSTPKGSKPLSTTSPIQIIPVQPISTPESIELFNFIEKSSIGNIQDGLANPDGEHFHLVESLVQKFTVLLNLPQPSRDNSLIHFTWELDYLSRTSSAEWVSRLFKVRGLIEDKYSMASSQNRTINPADVLEMQQELRMSMAGLRRNSLSMQDIWRATWIHAEDSNNNRNALMTLQTEYLQSGLPLELFHPTYSTSLWTHGVEDVIKSIPESTRIFVISTFGLKSSGKSTLLNALFGAGFTEYGTTFGMQFRLLYLNDELRDSTDCDAFLIIDSEGVGGPENKIDASADTLERKMVTLLLGISSITLATVLGPTMQELKEILEIGFTSLGKVNNLPLTPDIYLVQQHLPSQPDVETAKSEFSASLNSAIQVTADLEMQTGLRITEAHRLKQVKSRNKHNEVVHSIRSRGSLIHQDSSAHVYYHSDVEQLYAKIVHIAQTTRGVRLKLGDWVTATNKLWEEIYPINNHPFDAPSVVKLREIVTFEEKVANVKKAIDAAFFYHEKKAEAVFTSDLDALFKDYFNGLDAALENRLSALVKALQPVINTCEDMVTAPGDGARRRRKLKMIMAAEPNPNSCFACSEAFKMREAVLSEVLKEPRGFLVEEEITRYTTTVRDSIYERLRQGVVARQLAEQKSDGPLAGVLADIRDEYPDENEQFAKFLQYVSTLHTVIPARHRFHSEIQQVYQNLGHIASRHVPDGDHPLPDLKPMLAFDVQIYNSALESAMNARKAELMTWQQHDWLVARLRDIPGQMKADFESVLYRVGMARELQNRIQKMISLFEEFCGEKLLPNFKWEVHFYAIQLFSEFIEKQQNNWDLKVTTIDENGLTLDKVEGGNPVKVLRAMQDNFTDFFLPTNGDPPPRRKIQTLRKW